MVSVAFVKVTVPLHTPVALSTLTPCTDSLKVSVIVLSPVTVSPSLRLRATVGTVVVVVVLSAGSVAELEPESLFAQPASSIVGSRLTASRRRKRANWEDFLRVIGSVFARNG